MRAWVLALVLGGCGFSSSGAFHDAQVADTPVPDDAAIDGPPIDGTPPPVCLGTFLDLCIAAPSTSITLTTQTINTASSDLCVKYTPASAVDGCVIAGQSITIPSGSKVSVTGKRRLILFATDSITITGILDAASHHGASSGPAADTGPCPTDPTPPTTGTQGGGGWGGSFGTQGNNGGNTAGGGIGGIPGSAVTITALGGGCPGGAGAANGFNLGGGSGGHGGGAVLLLAGGSIKIDGMVNASGAGGSAGSFGSGGGGGGGGGAGGMIVLEAPTVNIPGKCFANGGGGGEGGATTRSGNGGNESTAPDAAGSGGHGGTSSGGDGGNGAFGDAGSLPGDNGAATDGGGGAGGGGGGIIKVFSADQQGTSDPKKISPLPS